MGVTSGIEWIGVVRVQNCIPEVRTSKPRALQAPLFIIPQFPELTPRLSQLDTKIVATGHQDCRNWAPRLSELTPKLSELTPKLSELNEKYDVVMRFIQYNIDLPVHILLFLIVFMKHRQRQF
jgi:hypothetical protein